MRTKMLLAGLGLAAASVSTPAAAAAYLVGAQVYAAGEIGENRGGAYQYSTNSSTSHYALAINGTDTAISVRLTEGTNPFTFQGQTTSVPTSIVGLNLFFSDTAASFNPSFQPGVGIPGNLTVFTVAGSAGFGTPAAGTNVASYSNDGLSTAATSYSGTTSFQIGGEIISVAAYSAGRYPSGTFSLLVSPVGETAPPTSVPEPTGLVLLGAGFVGLCLRRRRNG